MSDGPRDCGGLFLVTQAAPTHGESAQARRRQPVRSRICRPRPQRSDM